MDDEVGELVVNIAGAVAGTVLGFVFSKYGARYFHGIGRRAIALLTLGRKRIPSCLRPVPEGSTPKPRSGDWLALFTGIGVFSASAAGAVSALLFL